MFFFVRDSSNKQAKLTFLSIINYQFVIIE